MKNPEEIIFDNGKEAERNRIIGLIESRIEHWKTKGNSSSDLIIYELTELLTQIKEL